MRGLEQLVVNALMTRASLLSRATGQHDRDISKECGYPDAITVQQYRQMYDREIGERVVSLLPKECWKVDPEIYETEEAESTAFEDAWQEIAKRLNVFYFLEKVDELSGIGRFGLLLLGVDDGQELSTPLVEDVTVPLRSDGIKLIYLRAFDESLVTISKFEDNVSSPRFGQPLSYRIKFTDPKDAQTGVATSSLSEHEVHWSRVIHIADNRKSSEVFGVPRMQPVYNRLYDLQKIYGGSAEMFWQGGFPGLSLEVNPNLEDVELDKEGIREEMQDYVNGLQRYLALVGVSAKSLAPQVADPSRHIAEQLNAIALVMGVPLRVFLGSEQAELASSQDKDTWNGRVAGRQNRYLTPMVLRPFVDRLLLLGILPPVEDYEVYWPDMSAPSDKDRADVAKTKTESIARYVQSGADVLIPPLEFLTMILGFEQDEAEAILDAVAELLEEREEEELEQSADMQDQIPPDNSAGTSSENGQVPPENAQMTGRRIPASSVVS